MVFDGFDFGAESCNVLYAYETGKTGKVLCWIDMIATHSRHLDDLVREGGEITTVIRRLVVSLWLFRELPKLMKSEDYNCKSRDTRQMSYFPVSSSG